MNTNIIKSFFTPLRLKLILIMIILLALAFPFYVNNSYVMNLAVKMLIYTMMALGLNILVGYTGLVSLGQAGFVAIGAYVTTILTKTYGFNFFPALLLSLLVAAVFGLVVGLPSLRLTGTYLSIITLGFGEIIRTIIIVWQPVTNGPLGIRNIPIPKILGLKFSIYNGGLYILTLICLLLVTLFCHRLVNSKMGRAFRAVKGDETAGVMMGIEVTYYKVIAFILAAVICALAGSLYSIQLGYIDQNTFTFDVSTLILSIVILGGMGTIRGMYVGSFILILLPEISRSLLDYRFVLYGLILVIMMRFRPQGILGWRSKKPYPIGKDIENIFMQRQTREKLQ